jgi:hypothetical protein
MYGPSDKEWKSFILFAVGVILLTGIGIGLLIAWVMS